LSIFNIQSKTEFNISKATWTTGNNRKNIVVKRSPIPTSNYTFCIYDFSLTGGITSLRPCRIPTEALHGAQLNPDIMINNTIVEKYT
jgi:hypothetical protein